MRSVPIALRAAAVSVALAAFSAVTAPTALAGEEDRGHRGSITVDPDPAHPGAQVKLRVNGCDGTRGAAKSAVFVADVDLYGRDGGRSPLYGEATISSHASPGWHSIRVMCDGHEKVSGSVQISPYRHPSHHASPVWPVHAGGGGMSAELAEQAGPVDVAAKRDQDDGGPSLPHTVIGAVLAAVATLAVAGRALALRRRRSGE
ncbi:hypothetical protein PV721_38370 [Streptomyces sp. MB09-01]|uniref:hypothetical protein n=1 Tax=Streptomyces sp. MB09-01 TaxID=3028666 RepID=UPI0029B90BE8|nr:hypothetical protein [Streptomyces sp. MB09-01]MDX3540073.1 hypothetical protein [Streptomyces sp. MB09-01]